MSAPPRVLVLRTAGTNCDAEAVRAFEMAGAAVVERHLDEVLARPASLREAAILCFPGGFTYGDDVSSGAVFATRLRAHLLPDLLRAVEDGRLVLGVCNGFQILVRAGVLPAVERPGVPGEAALGFNDSGRFEARWVTLVGTSRRCPWVPPGSVLDCPVAHGEGKFVPRDAALLRRLEAGDQVVLRYRMPEGVPSGTWPHNPNGSAADIAGVCDPTGRVLGLMPHPERNTLPWHHPRRTADPASPAVGGGLQVFRNAVGWARGHA